MIAAVQFEKACGGCSIFLRCCKQTWSLVGAWPSHSARGLQRLRNMLLLYCFPAQFDCQSEAGKR